MLDLRRLQILAALEAEGTMRAAAARLHMSTSAISQQMTLLEREVSLPLLERVGRRVRLNEAGKALVAHYREISAAVEAAETSLSLYHTDVRGTVAISTFPSFCSTILPHALNALRRAYPALETIVRDMEPVESVARLRSGDIDVAVVDDLHDVRFDGVVSSVLARDEIVLCLPADYEPMSAAPIRLEDLADERWVFDAEGSAFEVFTRSLCRAAGFEPRVMGHCSNLIAMLGLVRAGCGVALMSELNLGRETEDLLVRRLEPTCSRDVLVLTRTSGLTPAVRAVIKELRAATRTRYQAGAGRHEARS